MVVSECIERVLRKFDRGVLVERVLSQSGLSDLILIDCVLKKHVLSERVVLEIFTGCGFGFRLGEVLLAHFERLLYFFENGAVYLVVSPEDLVEVLVVLGGGLVQVLDFVFGLKVFCFYFLRRVLAGLAKVLTEVLA